jgi:hypothetical protein
MKKYVLSSHQFENIEEAEKKVTGYFRAGQLNQDTKIYEVSKVYDLELKVKKK